MQVRITRAKPGLWLIACITEGGRFYYEKIISLTVQDALDRAKKLAGPTGTIRIDKYR